ncbi:hypothetical protein [Streptomyces sp. bgisy153]|uniref:hypothetical protein n=1 Tax=Streptomyces sp. bgisy153 TaxID=3413793 RepID=UPI003D71E38E
MNAPHDRRPASAGEDDDQYSATVLGSQWIQRPGPDEPGATLVDTTPLSPAAPTVLRFGPGVTAALTHGLPAGVAAPRPPERPRRGPRRHALPALVLIAAVLFVLWRQGPVAPLSVREVTVTAERGTVGCGETAVVAAVVHTNGRSGTLTYRWVRNDGTSSGVLRTDVENGQRSTRLRLLWSFEGEGRYSAVARLRVLSPGSGTADVRFFYDCPLSPDPARP